MSSADRWQQVEAALDAVLQAEPADRPAILTRLCSGDPELRSELESLLAADATTAIFLETAPEGLAASLLIQMTDGSSSSEPGGAFVGRYRLVEEIGRGGMGTVWLAERADGQYEQRVALKLVKRGMDTDEIIGRFRRERQILARLEHPSIARLLDGGASDDGRPYFVMEHVAGAPITEWCDARRLPVEDRLRLFVSACRAVQHAHRSLVIHRDLKPSNVLLTDAGEVKLLDFGVAKLLGDEDALATRGGALVTPEYASPEQMAGEPVTTASDVWQLGVLLYELLTGRRPVRRRPGETAAIEGTGPLRPSTAIRLPTTIRHRDGTTETLDPAAASACRGTSPEKLRRRLRGDLDAIVLGALRGEPDRRYPSAEALAEDVERHLAHRPIRFAPESRLERAGKFVRRHRIGVAATAAVVLLGAAGGAAYTHQIRAERDRARLETAKAMENSLIMRRFFEGWDADAADRDAVSARGILADAARRADQELRSEPETLAATLSMLGDLQMALGESESADSLLARALAIQERSSEPPGPDLAATLIRRGRLLSALDRHAEAETSLRRAVTLNGSLFGRDHPQTLRALFELAMALRMNGRSEAEPILRRLASSEPIAGAPLATEAASLLGNVLGEQARHDEAIAILRPTLARQLEIFGPTHRSTLFTMRHLAGNLRERGELAEAEPLGRQALGVARALYGPDHPEVANTAFSFAILLERMGEFEEAERVARLTVAIHERWWGPDHIGTTALSRRTLAGILLARGDLAEAERLLRLARAVVPANHSEAGDIMNRLAYLLVLHGAPDAAAAYADAVAFDRRRPPDLPDFSTDGLHYLAAAARRMNDLALAENLDRRALALYRRQLPPGHPYRAAAALGLGETLIGRGRPGEAVAPLREAVAGIETRRPVDDETLAEARALLAQVRRSMSEKVVDSRPGAAVGSPKSRPSM